MELVFSKIHKPFFHFIHTVVFDINMDSGRTSITNIQFLYKTGTSHIRMKTEYSSVQA